MVVEAVVLVQMLIGEARPGNGGGWWCWSDNLTGSPVTCYAGGGGGGGRNNGSSGGAGGGGTGEDK